jgi:hypothetical protein
MTRSLLSRLNKLENRASPKRIVVVQRGERITAADEDAIVIVSSVPRRRAKGNDLKKAGGESGAQVRTSTCTDRTHDHFGS